MFMVALTGLAHRIMALPVDRLVAWCLFLVPLLVSFSIWFLLADEIERSLARKIGRWRRRSGNQAMGLLLLVTLAGATIFAMPALAQTSDRVACSVPFAEVRLDDEVGMTPRTERWRPNRSTTIRRAERCRAA
jgi:hypothetical protein